MKKPESGDTFCFPPDGKYGQATLTLLWRGDDGRWRILIAEDGKPLVSGWEHNESIDYWCANQPSEKFVRI